MKSARALTRTFADILRTAQPPIYLMHPVPMQPLLTCHPGFLLVCLR